MTPEERQALREKHSAKKPTEKGDIWCKSCWYKKYPCDVIKVLDALDEADRRAVANEELWMHS